MTVDPSGLQDLQEKPELQETEDSPEPMVYQDKRELRANEGSKVQPALKVYLEIQDATESRV